MDDVTPRELMNDAARIGGWLRELRAAEREYELLGARIYEELGPLGKDDDRNIRRIEVEKRIRADRPELGERIRFLDVEVEAAMARGRLVEMAVVAERYAL
jgi:hypothetical protein